MDEVGVELQLDQGVQEIVRGVDVVVDGVVLVPVAFHRIGGGALFGEMDDGVRPVFGEPLLQKFVVLGEIDQVEVDAPAGFGVPDAGALLDRVHRRQRLHAEFGVDPASREIVEDVDVVAGVGEMQ
jgi:hypothetical protein